ncbi:hypothetical protein FIV00_15185 [Labrenzia sp. THAF82]|uniref:hypothetical protein n=1 Tax=Labrenzia sp. THAF82 TaxID=2587861 RepID=UPI0012681867|nr:hypothetical protein [Labrenzia sp. THAF82]QFT31835.1 hypothetical protein FIV00_15185 [Labrenzia sp. THAF82]
MSENAADWFTLTGLITTLCGAAVASIGSFMSKGEALNVGVAKWADESDDVNLKSPMVQSLLSTSKLTGWGLVFVGLGTLFQAIPLLMKIAS